MTDLDDPDAAESSSDSVESPNVALWPKIAAVLIGLTVLVILIWGPVEFAETILELWLNETGALALLGFAAFYVGATICFFPSAILGVAAGFLFGGIWGLLIALLCRPLGALLAFVIGRHLARDHVRHWIEDWPKFAAVDRMTREEPFRIVMLLRLVPVLTFNITNYVFGLTAVGYRRFFAATFLGVLPGSLFYVYIGVATGDLTRAVAIEQAPDWTGQLGIWLVGAAIFLGLLSYMFYRGRRYWLQIVEEQSEQPTPETP